ncbi:MAG: hypothetical protein AB8B85_00680 [Paracoccaceae bacterium]
MTEIAARVTLQHTTDARHRVDLRAFILAAFLAPLTLAAAGVVALHGGLLISVITAVMSLPGYICLGLPAAWLAIRHGPDSVGKAPDLGRITGYALIAAALLIPLGVPVLMVLSNASFAAATQSAAGYAGIGLIVGPIEALLFAAWYRKIAPAEAPRTDPKIFN